MLAGQTNRGTETPEGGEGRNPQSRGFDEVGAQIPHPPGVPPAAEAVERWLADHPTELWTARGHDHAVVGGTLMYLHDAPDGTVIPHECRSDGRERVYTDLAHAEFAYQI